MSGLNPDYLHGAMVNFVRSSIPWRLVAGLFGLGPAPSWARKYGLARNGAGSGWVVEDAAMFEFYVRTMHRGHPSAAVEAALATMRAEHARLTLERMV